MSHVKKRLFQFTTTSYKPTRIMDLCTGGELYERLEAVKNGPKAQVGPAGALTEADAATFMKQVSLFCTT